MATALAQALPFPVFSPMTIDAVAEEISFPACITGPRPVVHEPVEYSAWVLAFACFQMGWTVLVMSGRHWMSMLMLRARMRVTRALHSLTFAWAACGIGWGLALFSSGTCALIFIWR